MHTHAPTHTPLHTHHTPALVSLSHSLTPTPTPTPSCVYVAPLDAIVAERAADWRDKFGPGGLGLTVEVLTGAWVRI